MTPKQRKIALREAGFTQAEIAEELGVTSATLSLVINERFTSRRVMDAIAGKIGKSTQDVFPKYFGLEAHAPKAA